jgi:predicted transposase/invertase (TIGR01784 family)
MGAKREYKDTLFSKLFSDPSRLRELYNALAGTDYGEDTAVEINTLEDVFFNNLKNDVSFTIDDKFVVLVEHQSTLSNNLPLRFLLYIARVLEKTSDNRAMYQEKLLMIPTPELIVLYNGIKPFPTEKTLRLSDAYLAEGKQFGIFGGLELTVRVVNINPNENRELLQKSETLNGYTAFVERVRYNLSNGMELRCAISEAIEWGVEKEILSAFLKIHGSEVQNMLMSEFNIDIAKEVWQEEAHEEGSNERAIRIARKLLHRSRPIVEIIEDTGLTREEIESLRDVN